MARVESDSAGEGSERERDEGDGPPSPSPPPPPPPEGDGSDRDLSSSSSSSSSSGDELEEVEDVAVLEGKAAEAERKIATNPYVYADHVALIAVLHKLKSLPRIRQAYERLSGICPMSPSQWLHWLHTEVQNAPKREERKQLHKLFRKSFVDCYSIHIYTEWLAMSMSNGEGESDATKVLNEALQLAGSDPIDGAMLWDTAREFEMSQIYDIDSTSEDYSSQVMRVIDIFNKQLSRPLLQTEKTIEEFRTFAEIMDQYIPDSEILVKNVEKSHDISVMVLNQLLEFENELESTKDNKAKTIVEKCDTYVSYIDHVKSLLNDNKLKGCDIVNLLNVLYDRITSECIAPHCRGESDLPESAEKISLEYIEHAREYGSDEYCLNVMEKVIRRCHRKSSLWTLKLHQLERMEKDFNDIKEQFETSLFCGFDTADEYVSLWLCYLEILKRKTNFSSSNDIEILRKTFRLAWDSLSEMWGDEADKEFTILQYWARIEYQHTKDYKYAEELFKEILDYGDNKLRGGLWLEYIWLERLKGDVNGARSLFRKAVRNSPDPRLQRAWHSFERDFGTLDTLTECVRTSAAKAAEWEEIKTKKLNNAQTNYKSRYNKNKNENVVNKNKSLPQNKNQKNLKRHHEYVPNNEESSPKKQSVDKVEKKSYGKNAPEHSMNVDAGNSLKRKSDGITDNTPKKLKSNDMHNFELSNKPPPGFQRKMQENVENEEKSNRTVFVSNLDFNVNEEMLKTKLSEYGTIDELRLVTNNKKFGSICYCVYLDDKSIEKALSNDRTLLNDRPMFISRYHSSKDTREKHFKYSTGVEKNKLFVRNISFDHCTSNKLRELFEKFGKLKDVRIVTQKSGKPKGIAYVEYVDEQSASAAINAMDGKEVGGRTLGVVLSAPPVKGVEEPLPSTSRGYSRTKLFVPTVLQKSSVKSTPTPVATSKLSNSDFRDILMGKKTD